MVFICAGCFTIVINANATQTEYSAEEVVDLLRAPKTLCFLGACLFFNVISVCVLRVVLSRLRRFERDVESYEKAQGLEAEASIFPPREQ